MAQSPKIGGAEARKGFNFFGFMSPSQANMAKRRMSRRIAPVDLSRFGLLSPQKQPCKSKKALRNSNSVVIKKEKEAERSKGCKFNSYKRMNNRKGRKLLKAIQPANLGIKNAVPDKKIQEKINYYFASHHKKCHLSNEEDIATEEMQLDILMNPIEKATKKWVGIANLVLKNDKKDLRKCLKMMRYGLFQNYKKIKGIQNQNEYIRNDKIEETKKMMKNSQLIDNSKDSKRSSQVGYIGPVMPKKEIEEESSDEDISQSVQSFLSKINRTKKKEVNFDTAPLSPQNKKPTKLSQSRPKKKGHKNTHVGLPNSNIKNLRAKRNSSNIFNLQQMALNSRNSQIVLGLPGIKSCDSNILDFDNLKPDLNNSLTESNKEKKQASTRLDNILVTSFSQKHDLSQIRRESSFKIIKSQDASPKSELRGNFGSRIQRVRKTKLQIKIPKVIKENEEEAVNSSRKLIKQRGPSLSQMPRLSCSVSQLTNIYLSKDFKP
ncbi:unnamed protein product [Moneuplotes crassus]|uniref:Uncharacterized protein n=1 Tax=Euplotes crassus TaxID=5936 RepID=A0AAD1U7P4_EUPCR|nr:unnamed protein product [Moneuplotes crassus]